MVYKLRPILLTLAILISIGPAALAAHKPKPPSPKKFDALAQRAIAAMRQRAAELKVTGVAVVNYAPGETIEGWMSRMAVVGRMTDPPSDAKKGNNLLGIAYAKASEMAETLKDSGTSGKAPMTGEFGWQGGVIGHGKTGHIIVAFSGGKSEDDVQISRAGLAILEAEL